ncbi:MAG TPA: N,N-dimethylformamidase beta subunit family domain-containing protein [Thermoanaerobaculia bacterium]
MPIPQRLLLCTLLLATTIEGQRVRAVRHPAPPIRTQPEYTEGGYADAISVVQGGSLTLRIATSVKPFTVEIVDLAEDRVIKTIDGLTSAPQDCTGRHVIGCGWQATYTLDIPATWPSSHYAARFPTRFGTQNIFFVVRPATPAATSRTLLIASTHTYQAYNRFGGRNVYPSTSPERSTAVTYDRPFHDYNGLGRFPVWDEPFVKWMRSEGRTYEVATESELEDPATLMPYDLVIFNGHSEYWTRTARENLERYSASGRHIAIFGGNTMWWQIRLENQGRMMIVYKNAALDPERDPRLQTVNWFDEPVLDPENSIAGASFRYGGFVNTETALPRSVYTIAKSDHWALAGTGATRGDTFGGLAAGGEVDGVLFNCDAAGFPDAVDGSDATPHNYEILASVPATAGFGTIGLYTNSAGGVVFNAGTQDWARALTTDPIVRTITRNVLDRLSDGEAEVPRFVEAVTRTRDTFNCAKVRDALLPGWRGEEEGTRITSRCAREGPSGLELGDGPRVLMARNFAPRAGDALSNVDLRFDLDVSSVVRTADATVGLVTLQSRVKGVNTRRARVELQERSVRLALYAPDGVASVKSDWVALTPGWHTLQLRWSSPGEASLNVDNGTPRVLAHGAAGLTVNEVSIFYPAGSSADGHACIDDISVR